MDTKIVTTAHEFLPLGAKLSDTSDPTVDHEEIIDKMTKKLHTVFADLTGMANNPTCMLAFYKWRLSLGASVADYHAQLTTKVRSAFDARVKSEDAARAEAEAEMESTKKAGTDAGATMKARSRRSSRASTAKASLESMED